MNNNVLEFFVKMKDMMSGGLAKVGQTAQATFAKVQESAKAVETTTKNVFSRAAEHVRGYVKELKAAQLEQRKMASGGGGSGAMGLLGFAKGFIGPALISALLMGTAGKAIGGGMGAEKDKVGLTTFLGKSGAESAYSNIRKDAAATPYDTASLLMVNRSLISAGLNAQEARKDTMNLANAIAAVGGGNDELGRMAANMQQIKTVGKATAMDIRQFAMTGVNIYEMLHRATGKSIDQVKEMDVTYDMLSSALAQAAEKGGMYFGALDAMSKTTEGRWNTFKDTLANTFADFGTRLLPFVNVGLDIANSWLEKIVGWFSSISFSSSEWSGYLEPVKSIFFTIWNVAKAYAAYQWHILSGVIEWVKKSELLQDIFWAIGKVLQGVGNVIIWIVDKLKWLWDNVLKPILEGVELIYKATKNLFTNGAVKFSQETKVTSTTPVAATSAADNSLSNIQKAITGAKGTSAGGGDVAKGVTSGGPRVINISGVKFTDKIEIHTTTGSEALDNLEDKFRMMFARLLNSGATVQ